MTAEWKPVLGWEGMYEISDTGGVWSIRRGRPLKPFTNKLGYQLVDLKDGGRREMTRVHRLVCTAFHGEQPPDRPLVMHLDNDPGNNQASNLKWGTQLENMGHASQSRRFRNQAKTHCPRGHAYDQDDTYRRPSGGRICRACRSLRRQEGLPSGDPRHGTVTGYSAYGCLCPDCRGAPKRYITERKQNGTGN